MHLSDRIGRRMKLHDLHVLMAVAQAGSMGGAARRLHTSQSAISRSIAELEHAFGVRLLDRRRQGIEPTEYGRALLDCGMRVFDELRQGVKKIDFLADPTAGEVRIGSHPSLGASFVSAVIDRLSRRHRRIVFHVMTGRYEVLHRELSERKLDLLIARRHGSTADERLEFEFLFNESYVVAAGVQSAWVRRRKITLSDLVSEPWVLPYPESVSRSVVIEAFRASGLAEPRTTVFTDEAEMRTGLLATGHFLTALATSVLRFPVCSEIKALPVELPAAPVPNGIVTLKSRTLSPVAQLFIETARDLAKPLAKTKS